jgi:hypothetical protein
MDQNSLFVGTVLNGWKQVIDRLNKSFDSFTDADLQREVSPGRNRVYYLLGHLTAVHDRLIPLLRLGNRLYPELDDTFISNPDRKAGNQGPSASELRKAWTKVNTQLTQAFDGLRPEEWLERHDSVTEADFVKEPLRNRLAVLLSRTSHAALHEGQIRFGLGSNA